jgi:dTDP-4-dehydrorhamnose 3,5-epimerase
MSTQTLSIEGAWAFTPDQHADDRGVFLEAYRSDEFASAVGFTLSVEQVNTSVSRKGTVRGIHFAQLPPSQAKYVTCQSGEVLDLVVDIRVGSPTFGRWEAVSLDATTRRAVYVAEGLGHAFLALTDGATVSYLCSAPYSPTREHGINPMDPAIGIEWPADVEVLLSPKDREAPTLAEAEEKGLLPSYDECQRFYEALRSRGSA